MERKVTLISLAQTTIEPGLRSISSYLKRSGYKVILIFLKMRFEKTVPQAIIERTINLAQGSLFIGISLMTHEFFIAKNLTQKLKETVSMPIVWGGSHAMVRPEECLNYCDFVCIGEGEETVLELAEKLLKGDNYTEIMGLWCKNGKNNNEINRNSARPLIKNLDLLPFPDFTFESHYLRKGNKLDRAITEEDKKEIVTSYYPLFSHRGCPYSCTYCINHFFLKRFGPAFHRKRSVESVISELVEAKTNFPFIKTICFFADDFLSVTEKELACFKKLYSDKMKLPFHVNITPGSVSREKLALLIDIGLKDVTMGIQSGSSKTLRLYKRFTPKEKILQASRILKSFCGQLTINYDFILDNPWESEEDLLETLELLTQMPPPYKILLYSLTLYPGTELHDKAKNEGLIKDETAEIYNKSYHADVSSNYLNAIFYLYSVYPLPRWLGNFLINKKVIHHPLYYLPYKIIGKSTLFLKGLHFLKYILLAVFSGNIRLLKIYSGIALREFKKIFNKKEL